MMKKSGWILFLNWICLSIGHAQVTDWFHNFGPHSQTATGAIRPNSVKSPDGHLTTVVLENDTLGLFQTNVDAALIKYTRTEHSCSDYTPLIVRANGDLVLVYNNQLLRDTFWLMQSDPQLNVIRERMLEFPTDIQLQEIGKLFEFNSELYLTGFLNGAHILLLIREDGSMEKILEAPLEIAFGDDVIHLDTGKVIFTYKYGNEHLLRCVSPNQRNILWEQYAPQSQTIKLDYTVLRNDNILYLLAQERLWEDGIAIEILKLIWLDMQTGDRIHEQILNLPYEPACFVHLHDFKYNPHKDKIYISYASCMAEPVIRLFELNTTGTEISGHTLIPYQADPEIASGIGQSSTLQMMPDGKLVFLYKNYKNAEEKSNLFVSTLNDNLRILNTLEINFEPRNSVESFTDLLLVDSMHLLVTGVVPHPDPNIFWEEVEYFTILLNLEQALSSTDPVNVSEETMVFPNPAHGFCSVSVPDAEEYLITDLKGNACQKGLITEQRFQIGLEELVPGTYIIQFKGPKGIYAKKLIVK